MLIPKKLQIILISAVLCTAYILWLAPLKPAKIANLKIIDSYFNLGSRISPPHKYTNDVALVTIDDESLRQVNRQWPWPRSVIASVIDGMARAKARFICADFVFTGKSVNPQEDIILVNTMKNAGNVLGAAYFGDDGRYIMPDEPIALSMTDFGFVNKPKDPDKAIRRMRPYFLSTSGKIIDYSLSLKAAGYITNVPAASLALSLPVLKDGTAYINFYGNTGKFLTIPAWKIMDGSADTSLLKDKIVFFGVTSESFHDTYNTPLGVMSGLTIDLNEILTYLNKSFYRYAKDWANIAIISAFTLVAVTCAFELPLLAGIFASIALVAASFSLGLILFLRHIITDVSGALFLTVISTALIHAARSIRIAMDNIILKKEAITDGLTGLYLYRYFELQLKKEFKSALYSRRDLALVIYDIDHFKKINDTYGHEFGNVILKAIAKSLRDLSRKDNIMARYGGEEFCVIIPGMKRDDAIKYAERLRNMVGTLDFKTDKGENVKVTMSAGIAMIQDVSSKDHSDFIKAADSALYRSKNEGRNRISVFYKSTSS